MKPAVGWLLILSILIFSTESWAWDDETHISIAKAAGYKQWFNAAGADIIKIKAGDSEKNNHYVGNPPDATVTAQMVYDQIERYDSDLDTNGHLYGAIIAAVRAYQTTSLTGKYAQYHLALCAHYVGDLSQPLHNIRYNDYNQRNHVATDGIINDEILSNLSLIEIYPIIIHSEADLAEEIARIANLSMKLGYRLATAGRLPPIS